MNIIRIEWKEKKKKEEEKSVLQGMDSVESLGSGLYSSWGK